MRNPVSMDAGVPFDIGHGAQQPDPMILATGRAPAESYVSVERFEAEREILRRNWLYIGRADAVADPFDYRVKDLPELGASILIVRGKDGRLRAFHNVCAHRNMKLVWGEAGTATSFRCPYHAWVYEAEGALKHIPDEACFASVERKSSGLRPITMEVWNGLLFVCLNGDPKLSLAEYLGGYGQMLADLPLAQYDYSVTVAGTMKANWKLGIEANNESYHVHALHDRTLRPLCSYPENLYGRLLAQHFAGPHHNGVIPANPLWRPDDKRPAQTFALMNLTPPPAGEAVLSDHDAINLTSDDHWLNDQFTLFPNVILTVQRDGWITFQFWPTGPETARFETTMHVRSPRTHSELYALHQFTAFSRDVGLEDYLALEKQQQGLRSGAFQHLQFGDSEILLRHFAAVLQTLSTATAASRAGEFATE